MEEETQKMMTLKELVSNIALLSRPDYGVEMIKVKPDYWHFYAPPFEKGGAYCFAPVGRYVGMYVGMSVALNLVQLITQ